MATTTGRIARDLMSEPHIVGRRISVLHIFDKVKGRGDSPESVAETFDLDLADVHHALAFYYDHPDEMKQFRAERQEAYDSVEVNRPSGVTPPN
ncbi:MAG TPA: DUF433 domain-containing protein [Halococcus sp.]|nr:DUF433 domain-containing protein [Halococcus sp.]